MPTTGHENEVVRVSGLKGSIRKGGNLGIPNKATCSTAAATAAKTITLKQGFALEDGAMVVVTFASGNTAAGATLAVTYTDAEGTQQTTAAKAVEYRGAALPAGLVQPKDTLLLKYNSSQWDVVGSIDQDLSGKADKSATVSNVSFNSSTSKIQQTINGTTTDVCSIAQGGYQIIEDNTNGIDELTPVGGATITDDNTNGLDVMTF